MAVGSVENGRNGGSGFAGNNELRNAWKKYGQQCAQTERQKETWWDKRQKRIKERMKEQVQAMIERAEAQSELAREISLRDRLQAQGEQHALYAQKVLGRQDTAKPPQVLSTDLNALAADAYGYAMDLFQLSRKKR